MRVASEGLKLAAASGKADQFYLERLPISYSEIASELGVLKNKDKVRLRGRILFLTEDPELIKRQLAGWDMPWDTQNPANNPNADRNVIFQLQLNLTW